MSLPTDDKSRKALPIFRGPLMYFPDAIAAVAAVCKAGNDQHNPGEPLHWARGKSMEQLDTALRHMMDHGMGTPLDTDGMYHMAKAAWRCLAELQLTIERDRAASAERPKGLDLAIAESAPPATFKLGDRVRVIDDGHVEISDHRPGSRGVVDRVDETGCAYPYRVRFDDAWPRDSDMHHTWYKASQLTLYPCVEAP